MPKNNQPKTILWKLTEDQVKLLNVLLSHCPTPLDQHDQETLNDIQYELEQFQLELENE